MAVAGLLAQYLAIKNQLSYCELQETRWNDLSAAMSKKVSEQESAQSKWDGAYGSMEDGYEEDSKDFKAGGTTFQVKGVVASQFRGYGKEKLCSAYANAKVPKFDQEKLDEYTDLDMEYEQMSSMYDTLISELEAQADGLKDKLGTEAQDTHMLS